MNEPDLYTPPSRTARQWAMLCHLSALLGFVFPFGHLLGPLVLWQLKKEDDPFIDAHGREALNFQITVSLWLAVSFVLIIVLIGFAMIAFFTAVGAALAIVAAIKANQGRAYRYPLTLRLVK